MARAKALTRPITRKQARSYDKTYPNGRGVTALAELNGRGAYARRYGATRRMLSNTENAGMYTAAQKRAMKKMTPAQKRAFQKMLGKGGYSANKPPPSPSRRKTKRRQKARASRKPTSTSRSKTSFIKAQQAKGRSKAQAKNDWELANKAKKRKTTRKAAPKRRKAAVKRGRQSRKYGGAKRKYKAARAVVGPKSRWTYKYVTKKGKKSGKKYVRDIPDFAILGFNSAAEMRSLIRELEGPNPSAKTRKRAQALDRKIKKVRARREKAAERAAKKILAGKGMFVPNASDTFSYEEYEDMIRPNRRRKKTTRRRKKTTRKRRQTAAQRRASMRNIKKAQRAAKRKRGGTTRRKKAVRRKTTARRKTTRRAPARRKTTRRRTMRKNQGAYKHNRRKKMRKNGRKRYTRNQGFADQLMGALKLGAIVTGGYLTHRVLTKLVDENLMAKVEPLNKGKVADYRTLISGIAVAVLGIPASVKLLPKQAAPIAAGMATSLIHSAIMATLKATGQDKYAGYLGAYPNAEGRAYGHQLGSYYTFSPHEVFDGMGSYYSIPQPGVAPLNGFGQAPMVTQAAAGFGNPMLTQAAAGMGQPMLTQAAAGMGQITQAAAGTGEYIAYGTEGIGDYESAPISMSMTTVDEGIYPNLHSAEQALSAAESLAGVSDPSIPLQSTVNPTMIADPVADAPHGSRSGVFQGGDGIFG